MGLWVDDPEPRGFSPRDVAMGKDASVLIARSCTLKRADREEVSVAVYATD